jgi:hypothetical protein
MRLSAALLCDVKLRTVMLNWHFAVYNKLCFQAQRMIETNKFQLRRLRLSLEKEGKAISLFAIFLSGWKFYVSFLIVLGSVSIWLWKIGEHTESMLWVGIIVGVFWRDLTYARVYQRFKPISDSITDWTKVKQLLSGHDET